jgi:hypothetical protein
MIIMAVTRPIYGPYIDRFGSALAGPHANAVPSPLFCSAIDKLTNIKYIKCRPVWVRNLLGGREPAAVRHLAAQQEPGGTACQIVPATTSNPLRTLVSCVTRHPMTWRTIYAWPWGVAVSPTPFAHFQLSFIQLNGIL